jgi:hypothetical protein
MTEEKAIKSEEKSVTEIDDTELLNCVRGRTIKPFWAHF